MVISNKTPHEHTGFVGVEIPLLLVALRFPEQHPCGQADERPYPYGCKHDAAQKTEGNFVLSDA